MKSNGLSRDQDPDAPRSRSQATRSRSVDLSSIDPRKITRARELLGSVSATEAIEVALDLLVLDDAFRAGWP